MGSTAGTISRTASVSFVRLNLKEAAGKTLSQRIAIAYKAKQFIWWRISFRPMGGGYSMVSATVEGGGTGDNRLVPGPAAPEPATLLLLCLGSLSLLRRRKPLN